MTPLLSAQRISPAGYTVRPRIVDETVVVTPEDPVMMVVPVRPLSCGEYHYWDGERRLDARYHNPDLGPR